MMNFIQYLRFIIGNMLIKNLAIFILLLTLLQAEPFSHLQFFEYCRSLNYPVEDHIVPTQDHYNLRFYRLQAKNTSITQGKRVVYLQHGLVDSSDTWIVNDQYLAVAFVLANQGFDVWVGNSRGNRYSTKSMSPSVLKFWQFTFHDMAMYDLPAAFNYIARVTNRKIHYIGHSQGTLIMFIALSQHLETVSDNLLSFHAFAPIAYLNHQTSKVMGSAAKANLGYYLYKNHIKELLLEGKEGLRINSLICKVTPLICSELLYAISDTNNSVNNLKRMPVVTAHFPAGTSTKNLIHFQQFIKTGEFKMFDYGAKTNQAIYGQKRPPFYDLSKITFPVHLYMGKYDRLADETDVEKLFNQLVNSSGKTKKIYDFGHATFIWGKTIPHLKDALAVIQSVEPL